MIRHKLRSKIQYICHINFNIIYTSSVTRCLESHISSLYTKLCKLVLSVRCVFKDIFFLTQIYFSSLEMYIILLIFFLHLSLIHYILNDSFCSLVLSDSEEKRYFFKIYCMLRNKTINAFECYSMSVEYLHIGVTW